MARAMSATSMSGRHGEPSDVAPEPTEDHDGLTVLSSDVVALRRQLPAWTGDAVPALAVPTPRTPPPAKLLIHPALLTSSVKLMHRIFQLSS